MLRNVWIATHRILHPNGWVEEYTFGVFASKETAESACVSGPGQSAGPYEIFRYDDGDVYVDNTAGHRCFIIQPHQVEYQQRHPRVAA